MHELAVTREIVRIVEERLRREGGGRAIRVVVEIGALSHVTPEAVALCFEACARNGPAEGAELVFRRVPGRGVCQRCHAHVTLNALLEPCPRCGAPAVRPTAGQDLRVLELEVG